MLARGERVGGVAPVVQSCAHSQGAIASSVEHNLPGMRSAGSMNEPSLYVSVGKAIHKRGHGIAVPRARTRGARRGGGFLLLRRKAALTLKEWYVASFVRTQLMRQAGTLVIGH